MNSQWGEIIDQLFVLKKEHIDIEKIKDMLTYRRDYDIQVIDNLYCMGVLDISEYMEYAQKCKAFLEDAIKHIERVEERVRENPDGYDPMGWYVCAPYRGSPIDHIANMSFEDRFGGGGDAK